jgi:hypothetical protein
MLPDRNKSDMTIKTILATTNPVVSDNNAKMPINNPKMRKRIAVVLVRP